MKLVLKYIFPIVLIPLFSCEKENKPTSNKQLEIIGADISFLPEIRASGIVFYNQNNMAEDMLTTLKNAGINTIRLRVWYNPSRPNSNFETVKKLSNEIKGLGLKTLITVHYSDTWADPSQQAKPLAWNSLSTSVLSDSVYNYTRRIVQEMNPTYIQIGNEINNGFLLPNGSFSSLSDMKLLLKKGIDAVRITNSSTQIILHYAGISDSENFFSKFNDLNYDIIGLSYYPMWHGKNLDSLQNTLSTLGTKNNKKVFIAETSYPFTLNWNDWTHNVIGLSSQLHPNFEASPTGQKNYLQAIKTITTNATNSIGFCYWGAEWVSYKGSSATNGSSYENQALWDFNNKALPVLEVLKQ